MAKTPEIKASEAFVKAFDSSSLNVSLTAHFTYNGTTWEQRQKLFHFALNVIREFSMDTLQGRVTPERADQFMVASAMIDAMSREGYFLE